MLGAGPVCVCAGRRQTSTFPAAGKQMREWPVSLHCWGGGTGLWKKTLQIRSTGQSNAPRKFKGFRENAVLSKGKCQPLLPWGTLTEAGSSVWWPKTERNYKNDQNEAVHESRNKTKLPVSRISDCPLASRKQDAPQALKLGSLIHPLVSKRLWVWIAGKGAQRKAYTYNMFLLLSH